MFLLVELLPKKTSLPVWGVWIEILPDVNIPAVLQSLPVWGVWIEIAP